ncbi:LOW QUALITY PROTEIN: hypothetical protein BC936DRAFT_138656 [Jimgerdemannia flammicorona]|uniref:Uncharacterized protein n=1 Tax=Jimgerdemannia flammicorona TaxID=994334 RepID=A0A433BVT6_9FUNG|nr:LOW QUALITY PROTEIN: hypothetical protein BC936DRAFT_138656 [Jimgerdemannia flammicorona]
MAALRSRLLSGGGGALLLVFDLEAIALGDGLSGEVEIDRLLALVGTLHGGSADGFGGELGLDDGTVVLGVRLGGEDGAGEEAGDKGVGAAGAHEVDKVRRERVQVLLEEPVGRVVNGAGEVVDAEREGMTGFGERRVCRELSLEARQQVRVRGVRGAGLEPRRLAVEEADHASEIRLLLRILLLRYLLDAASVIHGDDGRQRDTVAGHDGVYACVVVEQLVDDELLSALISEIDTELLERVILEILEAELVEDAHEVGGLAAKAELGVDGLNDPREEHAVEGTGEGVALLGGAGGVQEDGAKLLTDQLELVGQGGLELDGRDAEHGGHLFQDIAITNAARILRCLGVVTVVDELEVKDGGEQLEDLHGGLGLETTALESSLEVAEGDLVVHVCHLNDLGLGQVVEVLGRKVDVEGVFLVDAGASEHGVESVVGPLVARDLRDARLVEEVGQGLGADNAAAFVELQLLELAEPGRRTILHGSRVAEAFRDGLRIDDLLLDLCLFLAVGREEEELVDEVVVRRRFT